MKNLKSFGGVLVCVTFIITMFQATILVQALALPFTDVGADHPNYTAISYMYNNGIVKGYEDGTFRPENQINRAEFLKILVEGSGKTPEASKYNNCFTDVKDEWFAPYVCYAKSINWVNGYPDGSYKPAQTVNKVESIKMVLNSQSIGGIPVTVTEKPFEDVPTDAWFAGYVTKAKEMAVLAEKGTFLYPAANMSRAAICELLYQTIKFTQGAKTSSAETLATVSRIIDGDTVEVIIEEVKEKVRLLGINAPEISSGDCYAQESKARMGQLVSNKEVKLISDPKNSDRDKYGRLLRYVMLGETDIGEQMILEGFALFYSTYPITKAKTYEEAENKAKDAVVGLWLKCQSSHPAGDGLIISTVFYDGVVPYVESDEYVEIKNNSSASVNIEGYKITGSKGSEFYIFPSLVLNPGETVKVYTNQGEHSFNSTIAIWNNTSETAYLWDPQGTLVDEWGW
jgi:endonuclease YncB( thermonuclease family)